MTLSGRLNPDRTSEDTRGRLLAASRPSSINKPSPVDALSRAVDTCIGMLLEGDNFLKEEALSAFNRENFEGYKKSSEVQARRAVTAQQYVDIEKKKLAGQFSAVPTEHRDAELMRLERELKAVLLDVQTDAASSLLGGGHNLDLAAFEPPIGKICDAKTREEYTGFSKKWKRDARILFQEAKEDGETMLKSGEYPLNAVSPLKNAHIGLAAWYGDECNYEGGTNEVEALKHLKRARELCALPGPDGVVVIDTKRLMEADMNEADILEQAAKIMEKSNGDKTQIMELRKHARTLWEKAMLIDVDAEKMHLCFTRRIPASDTDNQVKLNRATCAMSLAKDQELSEQLKKMKLALIFIGDTPNLQPLRVKIQQHCTRLETKIGQSSSAETYHF